MDLAQAKVNEQYEFKKGKSRSKRYQSTAIAPKKIKTTESIRMKHISELEEDLKDLNDQIKYKEKRREQATLSRNYKLCDELTEDMSAIKKKRRECEVELQVWKRRQQQASWYTVQGNESH